MKPNNEITPEMLENEDKFNNAFFKKFKLRPAPQPLKLNDKVTKNYMFPTFYGDVTCAVGIFLCDYKKAKAIMPHPKVKPVRMTLNRAIVAFSCYIYRNVMNVAPYNEVAMTIPVMVDPVVNVPVVPMVADSLFKEFGYYVFSMPVTSLENRIRGNDIWGLPKIVREIDIYEEGGDCVTEAKQDDGDIYFKLNVPMDGDSEKFDVSANLYSRLDDDLLQSRTCFKGDFKVNKNMELLIKKDAKPDREYLTIGSGPDAEVLRGLGLEKKPFQMRYAKTMNACFDLPNPNFKSPVKF